MVRLPLMRNTVHIVSARDRLDWRPLIHALHATQFSGHFRHGTQGVNRDELLRQAERLPLRTFHGPEGQTLYDLPEARGRTVVRLPRPPDDARHRPRRTVDR
ncbi:hypothetical protein [Spongiactinospora sp. TRM90649]|uniref:hypothetical protein n=1 Tax=Spongiactinospora sp. TRM90649 TaxID=3031114 RepID=UPI0023F9C80B|nr:hypothetical protein [Spongiactinospora sp. TRM90649]MDF5757344.1 hypothetical protein [Spongiactinospora sp. TRM90649]